MATQGKRVLIVDDTVAIRTTLVRMLEPEGFAVAQAGNGIAALRALESEAFDLIITDVVMPDMDGLEFLIALRKNKSRPRVIAMSGGGRGAADDYLALAKQFGADATLEKPFGKQALLDAITGATSEK